jgi:hypothetical protein
MAETKTEIREFLERAMKAHPYIQSVVQALGVTTYTQAEFDKAMASLALKPGLYNLALSNQMATRMGAGLHVPVAISALEGGRKSILNLAVGEEAQTGSFLVRAKVFHQYLTRVNGAGTPPRQADYRERVTTASGQTVYQQTYRMTYLDGEPGIVHLQSYAGRYVEGMPDEIVYHEGICYLCMAGSAWWCGLPCVPIPTGDPDPGEPTIHDSSRRG